MISEGLYRFMQMCDESLSVHIVEGKNVRPLTNSGRALRELAVQHLVFYRTLITLL